MPEDQEQFADAYPRKRFFIDMFTRDIALEDCILDLIDNSIDALIRTREIDLEGDLLSNRRPPKQARVEVVLSTKEISVLDDCGGIPLEKALHEVFNFGHSKDGFRDLTQRGLGAYGIGLKRAIFKMGRHFVVESSHGGDGFRVEEEIDEWVKRDKKIEDWRFPLKVMAHAELQAPRHGTYIRVTDPYENIRDLVRSEVFIDNLKLSISRTYSFFLGRHVKLTVNGDEVEAVPIPVGTAEGYEPAQEVYADDGVRVRLHAGLAPRGPRGEWQMERAGWYVLCNGRIVVSADKTALTGWGAGILPQFHSSKGRGFVGLALFTSPDPLKLPWTTTKRGLNRESQVYLRARNRMQSVARPVYSYLESIASKEDDETSEQRDAAKTVGQGTAKSLFTGGGSRFTAPRTRTTSSTVSVQFRARRTEIEAVREYLKKPRMSASDIGAHAFKYFLENEEIE